MLNGICWLKGKDGEAYNLYGDKFFASLGRFSLLSCIH